jgi:hypothetical protein
MLFNPSTDTLFNVLHSAKPSTAIGVEALFNVRQSLDTAGVNAIAVENCIQYLSKQPYDYAIEQVLSQLKALSPEANRQVAVAYEQLLAQPANMFGRVNEAGLEAVNALYRYNAAKIISALADEDYMKPWQYNPVIAKLVSYAKAARYVNSDELIAVTGLPNKTSNYVTPVLPLGAINDNETLVAIDNDIMLFNNANGLAPANNVSANNIPDSVNSIMQILSLMEVNPDQANLLQFKADNSIAVLKALKLNTFAFDITSQAFVLMNGKAYTATMASSIISDIAKTSLPDMVLNGNIREVITMVLGIIKVLDAYLYLLTSAKYANVVKVGDAAKFITGKFTDTAYSIAYSVNNRIIAIRSYRNAISMLNDEAVLQYPEVQNALSIIYDEQLKNESNSLATKRLLIEDMSSEFNEYKELYNKISGDLIVLKNDPDANVDKINQLEALQGQIKTSMDKVQGELDNIASKSNG